MKTEALSSPAKSAPVLGYTIYIVDRKRKALIINSCARPQGLCPKSEGKR